MAVIENGLSYDSISIDILDITPTKVKVEVSLNYKGLPLCISYTMILEKGDILNLGLKGSAPVEFDTGISKH